MFSEGWQGCSEGFPEGQLISFHKLLVSFDAVIWVEILATTLADKYIATAL